MNDFPQIECKKHAYRQTQDGVVISFVVHPNDVTPDLASAPLGTRYMAVLVELNDNETAKPPSKHNYGQQMGIECTEATFRRFLWEKGYVDSEMMPTEDDAVKAVREICGVDSRANIDGNADAEAKCRALLGEYKAWNAL